MDSEHEIPFSLERRVRQLKHAYSLIACEVPE